MGLLRAKRVTESTLMLAKSTSKSLATNSTTLGMLTYVDRQWVPDWIEGEEAKPYQKALWEGIEKELEKVSPGCVAAIL
jgi:hypothetical protein